MMDKLLIKYASPTLAGIKTGNLFKVYRNNEMNLEKEIENYNLLLNYLDIYLDIIYSCDRYNLVYIYRSKMLLNILENKNVIEFLNLYEYEGVILKDYINHLKDRFKFLCKTPHEIGIFLGYPLDDVKDFIKYKGSNYKICGCWKVYNDIESCNHKFKMFKICTELFSCLYDSNYPLEALIYDGIKFEL